MCERNIHRMACNPGMCPDWESKQQPPGLQAGAQSLSQISQGEIFNFLHVASTHDHNMITFLCNTYNVSQM